MPTRWIAALLSIAVVAGAGEDPAAVAAGEVLAAWSGKAHDRIALLASARDPDPWLVAEELCVRGAHDAAVAFAVAARGIDAERLPAYVDSLRGRSPPTEAREAFARANALLRSGRPREALDALAGVRADERRVAHVRVAFLRGFALRDLALHEEAGLAFREAGGIALSRGWLAGAAATLNEAGAGFFAAGNLAGALAAWESRLDVERRRKHPLGEAQSLTNLGLVHRELGMRARAIELEERALGIEREGPFPQEMVTTLGHLAALYASAGDRERSAAAQADRVELCRRSGNPLLLADALNDQGLVHEMTGHPEDALAPLGEALAIHGSLRDEPGVARVMVNLARVKAMARGDAEALPAFEEAIRRAEEAGARATVVRGLWGLARSRLALGQAPEALRSARRGVAELERLTRALDDESGAVARDRWMGLFETGQEAALALGDADALTELVEGGRARGLLELLDGRETLRATLIPEDLRRLQAEAEAAESAARRDLETALRAEDRAAVQECRRRLVGAEEAVRDVVARIQRTRKASANLLYPEPETASGLSRLLRPDEALVLYGLLDRASFAVVVTRGERRIVRLPPRAEIESSPPEELEDIVVRPLALPPEIRRLLICPSGTLARTPFVRCAGERELAFVPSGTTYGLLLAEADRRGEGILALGDPDYGPPAAGSELDVLRGGGRFSPLPGSREEAEAIGSETLLGAAATEENLLAAIGRRERWRAVHLACHGSVDAARPRLSSLALAKGDMLHVLEVFRSRIPADLVVLSACETAVGEEFRAEGVMGFVRAFLFAGAPRVIVSLWKVDDGATKALMLRFYELWRGGAPCARALLESQRFVASQERWKDPKFWAAWQLWGLPE